MGLFCIILTLHCCKDLNTIPQHRHDNNCFLYYCFDSDSKRLQAQTSEHAVGFSGTLPDGVVPEVVVVVGALVGVDTSV